MLRSLPVLSGAGVLVALWSGCATASYDEEEDGSGGTSGATSGGATTGGASVGGGAGIASAGSNAGKGGSSSSGAGGAAGTSSGGKGGSSAGSTSSGGSAGKGGGAGTGGGAGSAGKGGSGGAMGCVNDDQCGSLDCFCCPGGTPCMCSDDCDTAGDCPGEMCTPGDGTDFCAPAGFCG